MSSANLDIILNKPTAIKKMQTYTHDGKPAGEVYVVNPQIKSALLIWQATHTQQEVLQSRQKALEWVLTCTGRWTEDSDVGLIQMSGNPLDRLIADELMAVEAQLKALQAEGKDG